MKYIYGCVFLLFLLACDTPKGRIEQTGAVASVSVTSAIETMDCSRVNLPTPNPVEEVSCRESSNAYCAFFPNGKPFYCSTKDGKLIHRLNKWGSSLTVSQFDKSGNQLSERYYAYGKLTRGADWDTASSVFTRFWWDENGQIRVYQYDFNGKVLDKYYFREGNKYIRYPLGNDMGEIDGPWKLEGQTIFIEGKEFYKLPDNLVPAPDTCEQFSPLCDPTK